MKHTTAASASSPFTTFSNRRLRTVRFLAAGLMIVSLLMGAQVMAQTTKNWSGGADGTGTSWATVANWAEGAVPANAANSNVVISNRNGAVDATISTLSVSNTRTLGLITFDNVNGKLSPTLNFDTNGSGSTDRILTLHTGVTLQNTTTSMIFRGNFGVLSVVLGANNTFTTSTSSLLQINSGVVISGGFGIATAGSGTVAFNAQNTFSGGLTVANGTTFRVGNSSQDIAASSTVTGGVLTSGQVGTGTLTLQNGSTLVSGGLGSRTLQNNLSMGGNVTIGATSGLTGTFSFNSTGLTTPTTVSLVANTTLTANVATSINNVIGGAFSLTKQGPGVLSISVTSPNTYSGGTTIASGTLQVGRSTALGAGPVNLGSIGGGNASLLNYLAGYTFANDINVVAGSGGVLTLGLTSSAAFSSSFTGNVALSDDLVIYSESADTFALRLTGSITGSKNLAKTGVGTIRLENNNPSYSGITTISEGALQIGSTGATATTGALGSGEVVNNAALVVNRSNAYALGNKISGTGSLTQTGAGKTTLSNPNNTYTGATTVNAGTLEVSGGISGTTSVSLTGGTLLLSGASESINSNATLSLALGTKVSFATTLNNRKQTFDSLALLGSAILDFGDGNTNQFAFTNGIAGLGSSTLSIYNWSANSGTHDVLSLSNSLNQTELDNIRFYSDGAGQNYLGTGNQISFTGPAFEVVPIPEPSSTALLGAAGLLGLVGFRERRRLFARPPRRAV